MSVVAEMIEALSLLTPCEVPAVEKVRIGNRVGDGGYVLINRLRPGQKVYSYGLASEVSFDFELAERGLDLFMYDHTISGLPKPHPNFHFFREGVGRKNEPDKRIFTLEHHIERNGHTDDDMILKMDVEGAEWDVLDSVGPAIIDHFEQVTMEIHDLEKLKETSFRMQFTRSFAKLTRYFNLVHVHANNTAPLQDVLGLTIAPLMELTFLRKDVGSTVSWRTFIPSALDVPNLGRNDHVLAFYPFMPIGLSPNEFKGGLIEAFRRATTPYEHRYTLLSAEIQRQGLNIATEGQCAQSSLSSWSVATDEAKRALRTEKTGGFAFHTDIEEGPWWQIDLGHERTFDELLLFNRLDNCSERASNILVELSNDASDWNIIYRNNRNFGGIDGDPLRVVRPRMKARYVRLRIPTHSALHLDGVEIYDWQNELTSATASSSENRSNSLVSFAVDFCRKLIGRSLI